MRATTDLTASSSIHIHRATSEDLDQVTDLDSRITGQAKPDYWKDIFERYATRRTDERFFLIATDCSEGEKKDAGIVGMIVGEVRGWEFGSEPCGWIFAVSVDPNRREMGVGEEMFKAICAEFRQTGITKVRTMVRRQNNLHMSFFRGEGMMAGPYTQLELNLDDL